MRLIIFTLAILISLLSFGQKELKYRTSNGIKTITPDTSEACNKKEILSWAKHMPSYEGGYSSLQKEIRNNIEINKLIDGYLFIWFNVNCKNKAYGYQVVKSINSDVDAKIIKILEEHQNWTSGMNNNEYVDCSILLKIRIKKGKLKILN